jgi:hypothetical protein
MKIIKLLAVLVSLIFVFFIGVNYSDSIKESASWLFESAHDEIELPDLSSEEIEEIGSPVDLSNQDSAVAQ